MSDRAASRVMAWGRPVAILLLPLCCALGAPSTDRPELFARVAVPEQLLTEGPEGLYGGDIRMGDVDGDGAVDFVVYRCAEVLDTEDADALKPCFIGAFDATGEPLWQVGEKGTQPARPGPMTLYDLDGDGRDEVICLFSSETIDRSPGTMHGLRFQIRGGETGRVLLEAQPDWLLEPTGSGANWVHQRFVVANLRGLGRARDFVMKLGSTVYGFTDTFELLWAYQNQWTEYRRVPSYIPAVGDIDGDGRDEVNGGYYLLDDDGTVLWERELGMNMDSVAIEPWDGGIARAICSGYGHVMSAEGEVIVKMGKELVPHGQELRVARFDPDVAGPQMMIRYNGHKPDVLLADVEGNVIRRFTLNDSPNHTGMESVYWFGPDREALLSNGGTLWTGKGERFADLPGLPPEKGNFRQGWYHCFPADVLGDAREEVVTYNPWDRWVYIFAAADASEGGALGGYRASARQYNARLLD